MRTLVLALLASLSFTLAVAEHAPDPRCSPDPSLPASGIVQFSVDDDSYYLVDDNDGDALGPHLYEETNGIGGGEDIAHALQREDEHADDDHPDLPAGCADPLVVPDRHVW